MFFFKSCPRCRGDMYLERDIYGSFIQCLQCSFTLDLLLSATSLGKDLREQVRRAVLEVRHQLAEEVAA